MLKKLVWMAWVLIAIPGARQVSAAAPIQVPMMVIHGETHIAASPAVVWAYLTTGKNFATWCPAWKATRNTRINIMRVGDVLDFMDEWGNGGRSIVTYCVQNSELRIAHEPNKGDYVCQAKIVLMPASGGTTVSFWDRYTDTSAPGDLEATWAKMQGSTDQSLAALKKALETK